MLKHKFLYVFNKISLPWFSLPCSVGFSKFHGNEILGTVMIIHVVVYTNPLFLTLQMAKISREDALRKKRDAEKLRRDKIRNDPVLKAAQQAKQRKWNETKFKTGKLKLVADMTAREHRVMKKAWRKNTREYCRKKKNKKDEGVDVPNPGCSSSNTTDASTSGTGFTEGRSSQQQFLRAMGKKRRKKNHMKLLREREKLKERVVILERKINTLRKRESRRNVPPSSINNNFTSPRSKVHKIMKSGDKKIIAKKLLFGEVLKDDIATGYKKLKFKAHKLVVRKLLLENKKQLMKYKIMNQYKCISSKVFATTSKKSTMKQTMKDLRMKKIENAVHLHVTNFFENDDVSKMCPGKKDCITVKKVKKQKRILLDSLKNLHLKFMSQENYKISYALFCRLKPFWVVIPKVTDRDTCACKIHSNAELLVEALHKAGAIDKKTPKEISSYLCCDTSSVACLQRKCVACKNSVIPYLEFQEDESIQYDRWETTKQEIQSKGKTKTVTHTAKKKIKSTLLETIDIFEKEMCQFMHHEGIYIHQFREIDYLKKRLAPNEVLIHCDFSENYSAKYGTEIQSFHFGGSRSQYTLHTVQIYYRKDTYSQLISKSLCTLSECNDHNAMSIWAHLNPIFQFIRENCSQIEVVHFLSDAPSTQYRNRTLFYLFAHGLKFMLPTVKSATWNYSASGHGKGAPDGIGGCLKRTADAIVAQGADIANFPNFVATLQAHIRNVTLYVIHEEDISAIKTLLPPLVPSFHGTMKVQQITYSQKTPHQLVMKSLSCLKCIDCDKFKLGILAYECDNTEKIPMNDESKITSNESYDPPVEVQLNEPMLPCIDDAILKKDVFILAEFEVESAAKKKKTSPYRYVCCVMENLTVQGFRSYEKSKKQFILRENDICNIEKKDVIQILPQPEIRIVKRKKIFIFPAAIDINETS